MCHLNLLTDLTFCKNMVFDLWCLQINKINVQKMTVFLTKKKKMMKKKTCLWVCVMSDFDLNWFTLGRRQLKMLIQSTNVDKKSLETEFLLAICRHSGDKWQSKTLFLSIFLSAFVDC